MRHGPICDCGESEERALELEYKTWIAELRETNMQKFLVERLSETIDIRWFPGSAANPHMIQR